MWYLIGSLIILTYLYRIGKALRQTAKENEVLNQAWEKEKKSRGIQI